MSDAMEDRLNRIENKLDRLSDAMTTMARIEERMAHNQDAHARIWKSIEKLSGRVASLEKESGNNTFITRRVERFAWVVLSALLVAAVAVIKGWFG